MTTNLPLQHLLHKIQFPWQYMLIVRVSCRRSYVNKKINTDLSSHNWNAADKLQLIHEFMFIVELFYCRENLLKFNVPLLGKSFISRWFTKENDQDRSIILFYAIVCSKFESFLTTLKTLKVRHRILLCQASLQISWSLWGFLF